MRPCSHGLWDCCCSGLQKGNLCLEAGLSAGWVVSEAGRWVGSHCCVPAAAWEGGGRAMTAWQAAASRAVAADAPSAPAWLGTVQPGTLPWPDPARGGCTEQPAMCSFAMRASAPHTLLPGPGQGACAGAAPPASVAPSCPRQISPAIVGYDL